MDNDFNEEDEAVDNLEDAFRKRFPKVMSLFDSSEKDDLELDEGVENILAAFMLKKAQELECVEDEDYD
jgi:hypothetical protein